MPRLDEIARTLARVRGGKRVVLANGGFEILHVGHVRYLEAARREGDLLVVAVNDDRSLRILKGAGRPVVAEAERLRLVAGISAVDIAFLFEGNDVRGVLRALRPDVHAKGTDYTEETVPERETSREVGAITRIVGDAKSHATRDLIARIASLASSPPAA
ncbi:MAG: adenylyltransferase/cytidyltransferase family protein [bacterium]